MVKLDYITVMRSMPVLKPFTYKTEAKVWCIQSLLIWEIDFWHTKCYLAPEGFLVLKVLVDGV